MAKKPYKPQKSKRERTEEKKMKKGAKLPIAKRVRSI